MARKDSDRAVAFEDQESPPEVDDWYWALSRHDCKAIMQLLQEHPSLLKVGWEVDLSRDFKGYRYEVPGKNPFPFKGCTALHVGAQQGCVDLIVQVLQLFHLDAVSIYHSSKHGQGIAATPGPSKLPESKETETQRTESEGNESEGNESEGNESEGTESEGTESEGIESEGTESEGIERTGQNILGDETAELVQEQNLTKEKKITPHGSGGNSHSSSKHLSRAGVGEHSGSSVDTALKSDDFSREDLRNLLLAKDGTAQQVALAMAALHYNVDAIILLIYAYGQIENPPLGITKSTLSPTILDREEDSSRRENRAQLRLATKEFIENLEDSRGTMDLLDRYSRSSGFSFLPREEYFFHFLVEGGYFFHRKELLFTLWKKVRSLGGSVWRFLLELQDGRGRTPFHLAAIARKASEFVTMLRSGEDNNKAKAEVVICALTAPDRAGRTPAHRAAVLGHQNAILVLLHYSGYGYEKVSATFRAPWHHPCRGYVRQFGGTRVQRKEERVREAWEHSTDKNSRWRNLSEWKNVPQWLSRLSAASGFREVHDGHNPVHAAIMHRHYAVARLLMARVGDTPYYQAREPGLEHWTGTPSSATLIEWDIVTFACYVGLGSGERLPTDFVKFLRESSKLKISQGSSKKRKHGTTVLKMPWKALHVIASRGDYRMLKSFVDSTKCDPFIEDFQGNTALHYAMHVREFGEFRTHLLDHVWSRKLRSDEDSQTKEKGKQSKMRRAERQGCINLLLQLGCDAFKENDNQQGPYPQGDLENPQFLLWWYDKQEKEFAAAQTNLNSATTAISVTATLVATASFVGPLQPPLSLTKDNQIQYQNGWVATFVFCDTLSFYLAIIALILSLVPSLPVPQQPMTTELGRTRAMVVMAVIALFPSIISVLLAFVASSMAVVSTNLTSSLGGKLTYAPLSICGPFIVGAFFVLLIRLLGILFPQNRWMRKMYKLTSIQFK